MNCAPGFAELARLPDADKTALFAAVEPSVLGPAMWLAPEEIYRRCEPFLPSEVQEFVDRERAFQGRIPKRYHPRSEDGLPGLESIDDLLLLTEREIQMTMREVTSAELALALRGCSDELRSFVLSNMSGRAQASIRDEMTRSRDDGDDDVDAARKGVLEAANGIGSEALAAARAVVAKALEAQKTVVETSRRSPR